MLRDGLMELTAGWKDLFEQQRRNIGKAFGLANEIREVSKKGMLAIEAGDATNIEDYKKSLRRLWEELNLEMPRDISWRFDTETGQEMVEFFAVAEFYPALLSDKQPDWTSISAEALEVAPQTWLAGIGDAATEIGKLELKRLGQKGLFRNVRITIREKHIMMLEEIRDVLGQFETAYPMVINNSRRPGFFNTYRGLLMRLDRVIESERQAIAAILDQESK